MGMFKTEEERLIFCNSKVGLRFNKLEILEYAFKKGNVNFYKCRCDCGNTKTIRIAYLVSGHTKTCGCLVYEKAKMCHYKKHGVSKTKLYAVWRTMISRCESPNNENYKNYGQRGISVCSEWKSVLNFYNWANENGYKIGLTIDRIDTNGNYEPNNCRWATPKEQSNNRRNNVLIEHNGVTKTIAAWSYELGGCPHLIGQRIGNGWSIERAITTKIRK